MYFVYIIQSSKNESFYIGFTQNIKKRVQEHNSGKNLSTKNLKPYKLTHFEMFLDKKDALNREKYLKSGYGRKTISKMLSHYLSGSSPPLSNP